MNIKPPNRKTQLNWGRIAISILATIVMIQLLFVIYKFLRISKQDDSEIIQETKDTNLSPPNIQIYSPQIYEFIEEINTGLYFINFIGGFTYPEPPPTIKPKLSDFPELIPSLNADTLIIRNGTTMEVAIGDIHWLFREDGTIIPANDSTKEYIVLEPNEPLYTETNRIANIWKQDLANWRESIPLNYIIKGIQEQTLDLKLDTKNTWISEYKLSPEHPTIPIKFSIADDSHIMTKISIFNEESQSWEDILLNIEKLDTTDDETHIPEIFKNTTNQMVNALPYN